MANIKIPLPHERLQRKIDAYTGTVDDLHAALNGKLSYSMVYKLITKKVKVSGKTRSSTIDALFKVFNSMENPDFFSSSTKDKK